MEVTTSAMLPPQSTTESGVTIVFLHGSAGSFGCYSYALSPLVRESGYNVIVPSFGAGNWDRAGGADAILTAAADAVERFSLESTKVYLVALSNGGKGAARVLAQHPGAFRGVALLSAILEDEPVAAGAARGAWAGISQCSLFTAGTISVCLLHTSRTALPH